MLKVNGIGIPTPSEFSVGIQDISKAERVASGQIVIDRIATKIKLEMSWKHLTPDKLSQLLTAIKEVTFNVEYPDPQTNSILTKRFYVGDRKVGMYSYIDNTPVYIDIGFNFIEV